MTGQTLRFYLKNCELPPLDLDEYGPQPPPMGHKSHQNHLKVRPEEWRRLECVNPLSESISAVAQEWAYENVMDDEPINFHELQRRKKNLQLPCPPALNLTHCLMPPDNVASLAIWIQCLPLQTVESVIHLLYPEFSHWRFKLIDDAQDLDRDFMRHFEWCEQLPSMNSPDGGTQSVNHLRSVPSLVIAFQPPWILSDQDIEEFAQCRSFPRFRRVGHAFPTPLDSHHRLWAKLWDLCARRNTRWFVLTSYTHWVFGGFSEGWSSGFITGVYPFWSTQPSIAEMLTFWLASSMQISGSVTLPKVGADPTYLASETLCTVYDILAFYSEDQANYLAPTNVFEIPSDSESNWEGKSVSILSSAGVYSQISGLDSLDSMATARARNQQQMHEPLIRQWIDNAGASPLWAHAGSPSLALQPPSPITMRRTAGAWLF